MKVGTDGVLLGAWAEGGRRILDIGTGTGVIALMMAQRFADATVTAIDIDDEACAQARENASASPFANRVSVVHSSVQSFAADFLEKCSQNDSLKLFDSIVSNPPFFEQSLKNALLGSTRTDDVSTDSVDAGIEVVETDMSTIEGITTNKLLEEIECLVVHNRYVVRIPANRT